jgi:hypothetical protein
MKLLTQMMLPRGGKWYERGAKKGEKRGFLVVLHNKRLLISAGCTMNFGAFGRCV